MLGHESLSLAADLNVAVDDHYWIIGDRCVYTVNGTPAKIAFLGETRFGDGEWAGVVFDRPTGKNDGSVNGVRYFQCSQNCGLFCRLEKLTKIAEPSPPDHQESSSVDVFKREESPLRVGDRVAVLASPDKKGVVRFLGETKFAAGRWAGLELDNPNGKNDGSVQGERYFTCRPRYGVFVPVSKLIPSDVKSPPPSSSSFRTPKRSSLADSISNLSTISCTSSVRSQAAPPVRHNVASKLRIGRHGGGGSQESLSSVLSTASKTSKLKNYPTAALSSISKPVSTSENHEECSRNLHALQMQMDQICLSLQQAVKDSKNFEVLYDEEKTKTDDLQFRLEEEVVAKQQLEAKVAEMERLLTDVPGDAPTMTSTPEKLQEKFVESKEYLDKLEGLEFKTKEEILARKEAEKLFENLQLEMESAKIALQQKVSERENEIEVLNSQLSKMHAEVDDQNTRSDKFEEKIRNLQSEMEKLRDENEILRQNSKNELEKHIYETQVLQNEAQDLKNQRNLLEKKHDEMETGKQNLKLELDGFRIKCTESDENLRCKESEIDALKLEFNEFKKMSSQRESEFQDKLHEMESHFETKYANLQQNYQKQKENLAMESKEDANRIVSEKQRELDALKLKFEECEAKSSQVENELSEKLEEQRAKYANLESDSQENAVKQQMKMDDLQKSFDERKAENLQLSEKLRQTEEKYANLVTDSQKNVESRNAEFDLVRKDLNDKIHNLEDEYKNRILNSELSEKFRQQEIEKLKNDSESLKENLLEKASNFEKRKAEFNTTEKNLNDKIRKLEDECKSYVSNLELLKEDHKKELRRAENDYKILQESQLKNASHSEKQNMEFHILAKNSKDKIRKLESECKSHVANLELLEKDCKEKLEKAEDDYKILQENQLKSASDFETRNLEFNALEKILNDKILKLAAECKGYVSKLEMSKEDHNRESEKMETDYQEKLSKNVSDIEKRNSEFDALEKKLNEKICILEDECKNHLLNAELSRKRHLEELEKIQNDYKTLQKNQLESASESLNSTLTQKQIEIDALQRDLENFKVENLKVKQKHNDEVQELVTRTQELSKNCQELMQKLENSNPVNLQKEKELDSLQQSSDEFKQQTLKRDKIASEELEKAENEVKSLALQLDKKRESLDNLQKISDEFKAQFSKKETSAAVAENGLKYAMQKLAEKEEQSCHLQLCNNKLKLEKDESNLQTENFKLEYEEICTENRSLKSKIVDLERLQAELSAESSTINFSNQQSVKLFEDKEKDCATKSLQLQNLEMEKNLLETKCKELENSLHSLENDITILRQQLIQWQERNATLTKDFDDKFESKLKHFNEVSEKYEKVKKEHEKRKTELNQLLDECSTSNDLAKNLQLENQRLSKILENDVENRSITKIDNDQDFRLQIEFLNSVIADLGAKNKDLEMKLEIFKSPATIDSMHNLNIKKQPKPRKFCDICEIFDAHETEDCPKQASGDFSDGENDAEVAEHHRPGHHHSKNRGQRGQQRHYCENCEAFAHDTKDCDQVQTF